MDGPDGHAADRYDEAVRGIEKPVEELIGHVQHNRKLIRVLFASIIFDVILSIGTGFATAYAIHAARLAASVNDAAALACQARNDFKALDLKRWQYIIDLSANAPTVGTPEEQAAAKQRSKDFVAYIEKADAPEMCS